MRVGNKKRPFDIAAKVKKKKKNDREVNELVELLAKCNEKCMRI